MVKDQGGGVIKFFCNKCGLEIKEKDKKYIMNISCNSNDISYAAHLHEQCSKDITQEYQMMEFVKATVGIKR